MTSKKFIRRKQRLYIPVMWLLGQWDLVRSSV